MYPSWHSLLFLAPHVLSHTSATANGTAARSTTATALEPFTRNILRGRRSLVGRPPKGHVANQQHIRKEFAIAYGKRRTYLPLFSSLGSGLVYVRTRAFTIRADLFAKRFVAPHPINNVACTAAVAASLRKGRDANCTVRVTCVALGGLRGTPVKLSVKTGTGAREISCLPPDRVLRTHGPTNKRGSHGSS